MTMTYPSQSSYRRLFAEGAAIVISILLAFAIEAWWDDRQDRVQEHEILVALKAEFEGNLAGLNDALSYRNAASSSVNRMFEAAAGQRTLKPGEFDRLLGDLGWSGTAEFSTGVIDGILQSGNLRLIENEELQNLLASMPGMYEIAFRIESADLETLKQTVMPFLFKNAFVPQISNTLGGMPGTGVNPPPHIPVTKKVDHSGLLDNSEFLGVITLKLWDHTDALWAYGRIESEFERAIEMIGEEIRK